MIFYSGTRFENELELVSYYSHPLPILGHGQMCPGHRPMGAPETGQSSGQWSDGAVIG